jgi:hypothetical protein
VHEFTGAVQLPATHSRPAEQSLGFEHGHGPAVPPHASHAPATHALPSPQSSFVVQSFFGPGSVAGAEQSPALQTSPFGHGTASEHVVVQPLAVQTDPGGQLVAPVHAVFVGGATFAQPYASHS